jgi:hypothetical protein
MKFLRLIALPLLLMLSTFTAFAQSSTPEPIEPSRELMQILSVSAEMSGDSPVLTITGQTTRACEVQVVEILEMTEDLLVANIYLEIRPEVRCAGEEVQQVGELTIEQTIPETGLFIDLNGQPFLLYPDGTFAPIADFPVTITNLTAAVEDDALLISITGETDGCDVPVIVRQNVEDGAVNLRVYRILPLAMTCPMILVEYTDEISIPLEGDESGVWVISANDREIGYDFDRGTEIAEADLTRIDATIESVQVNVLESMPPQVTITVAGYHPDGCVAPAQVRQQFDPETNTVTVRIYRVLPPDVMCPAVIENFTLTIPLDLDVVTGATYTINVNGTTAEVEF